MLTSAVTRHSLLSLPSTPSDWMVYIELLTWEFDPNRDELLSSGIKHCCSATYQPTRLKVNPSLCRDKTVPPILRHHSHPTIGSKSVLEDPLPHLPWLIETLPFAQSLRAEEGQVKGVLRNSLPSLSQLGALWPVSLWIWKSKPLRDRGWWDNFLFACERRGVFRGPQNHPKSRNTQKTPRLHELFRKVRTNFCLLPCDASQELSGNCSEKRVQMSVFYFRWTFSCGFPSCESCFVVQAWCYTKRHLSGTPYCGSGDIQNAGLGWPLGNAGIVLCFAPSGRCIFTTTSADALGRSTGKISTGSTSPRKYQRVPPNCYLWWNRWLSALHW